GSLPIGGFVFRKSVGARTRHALGMLFAFVVASRLYGQTCPVDPTTLSQFPANTGSPGTHELYIPPAAQNLYLPSEWGVLRASLADPSNRGPSALYGVGNPLPFPGVINIGCDCSQAWRTLDPAEDSTGANARVIGGWSPFAQGGPPPPGPVFSGL